MNGDETIPLGRRCFSAAQIERSDAMIMDCDNPNNYRSVRLLRAEREENDFPAQATRKDVAP